VELWNHCENPYPFVPAEILDAADSARASLPNAYCDPRVAARLYDEVFEEYAHVEDLADDELVLLARNWDALCLYAWQPLLFNPHLKTWLHRIRVPTLVVWGAADRIVSPEYGRAYSGLIPQARFEVIQNAGHHPELEQPAAFVRLVSDFLHPPGR